MGCLLGAIINLVTQWRDTSNSSSFTKWLQGKIKIIGDEKVFNDQLKINLSFVINDAEVLWME